MFERSEVYFLMKLVEKSEVPAWIDRDNLLRKLQDAWIKEIQYPTVSDNK